MVATDLLPMEAKLVSDLPGAISAPLMAPIVIGAADGAAGVKVLQSGARIDLLITDVGLPNGMNGRQVADAARSLRPGLKVLFITGYAENAAVGNGHLEPGMELLTKPFTLDALIGKVNEMIT